MAWASIPALPLASCVLSGRRPNLSVPLFLMRELRPCPSHRGLVEAPFVVGRQIAGTVLSVQSAQSPAVVMGQPVRLLGEPVPPNVLWEMLVTRKAKGGVPSHSCHSLGVSPAWAPQRCLAGHCLPTAGRQGACWRGLSK